MIYTARLPLALFCLLALPAAALADPQAEYAAAQQKSYQDLGQCVATKLSTDNPATPVDQAAAELTQTCHAQAQQVVTASTDANTHTPSYLAYSPEAKQAFDTTLAQSLNTQFIQPGDFFKAMVTKYRTEKRQ